MATLENTYDTKAADVRGYSRPEARPIYGQPLGVTRLEKLGEAPEFVDCPYCQQRCKTRVVHENSTATCLASAVCCLFTGIGAVIPCVCGWFEDTNHFCEKCNKQLTHKTHDGAVQVLESGPTESRVVASRFATVGEVQSAERPRWGETSSANQVEKAKDGSSGLPGQEDKGTLEILENNRTLVKDRK